MNSPYVWKLRWVHIRRRIIEESSKASKIEDILSLKRELEEIYLTYQNFLFSQSLHYIESDTLYENFNQRLCTMEEIFKDSRSFQDFKHQKIQELCEFLRQLVEPEYRIYSDDNLNNFCFPPVKTSFQFLNPLTSSRHEFSPPDNSRQNPSNRIEAFNGNPGIFRGWFTLIQKFYRNNPNMEFQNFISCVQKTCSGFGLLFVNICNSNLEGANISQFMQKLQNIYSSDHQFQDCIENIFRNFVNSRQINGSLMFEHLRHLGLLLQDFFELKKYPSGQEISIILSPNIQKILYPFLPLNIQKIFSPHDHILFQLKNFLISNKFARDFQTEDLVSNFSGFFISNRSIPSGGLSQDLNSLQFCPPLSQSLTPVPRAPLPQNLPTNFSQNFSQNFQQNLRLNFSQNFPDQFLNHPNPEVQHFRPQYSARFPASNVPNIPTHFHAVQQSSMQQSKASSVQSSRSSSERSSTQSSWPPYSFSEKIYFVVLNDPDTFSSTCDGQKCLLKLNYNPLFGSQISSNLVEGRIEMAKINLRFGSSSIEFEAKVINEMNVLEIGIKEVEKMFRKLLIQVC